jgi:hypothetical protein
VWQFTCMCFESPWRLARLQAYIQVRVCAVSRQSLCLRATTAERRQYGKQTGNYADSRPCESPHYMPCILCRWQKSRRRLCRLCERGLISVGERCRVGTCSVGQSWPLAARSEGRACNGILHCRMAGRWNWKWTVQQTLHYIVHVKRNSRLIVIV